MRPRYWYDGGPFAEATIHRSKHCSELESPKPLSERTVDDIDANRCSACAGGVQTESETEDENDEPETCEVVMSNGEVCGRERPCGYHDD